MAGAKPLVVELPMFDRKFWDGTFRHTQIGTGAIGGKARGLVSIKDLLAKYIDSSSFAGVKIEVPTLAVIATDSFDQFIFQNRLSELPLKEMSDDRIANAFQKSDLPFELLGEFDQPFGSLGIPWSKMKAGFEDLIARYPTPWNINGYASLACQANDKGAFIKLLPKLTPEDIRDEAWVSGYNLENCKESFMVRT